MIAPSVVSPYRDRPGQQRRGPERCRTWSRPEPPAVSEPAGRLAQVGGRLPGTLGLAPQLCGQALPRAALPLRRTGERFEFRGRVVQTCGV
ncbi:hypothetical protein ACIO3O_00380 [Streptomyces sp. NPDC087440]|uniref:hypothetical protein n=1 Tax=Streptomyces sp. NPDC087440 TaxID=3365790 RepID=UPI0037FFABBC